MILIADDDSATRNLIQIYLERVGLEVVQAENGKQAVEAMSDQIDVVLLDLHMPEMSGMECLDFIQKNYSDIPSIIITANDDVSYAVNAMKKGAFDYVVKPIKRDVLIALVKQAVKMREQTKNLKKLEAELNKARESENLIASKIQQALLLGRPPTDLNRIQVSQLTIASQKVDGDFYDFFQHSDSCFDLVVGDVMGKGVAAALLGAAMKSHLLHVINKMLRESVSNQIPDPEEIVTSVHSEMIDQLEELETFVTLCYARFDLENYIFSFVDCGHMRPIHYQRETNDLKLLQGINMPLGFPEKNPFKQVFIPFKPGDIIIFYSDGLTEAMNPLGDLYGEERLIEFIQKNVDVDAENLINNIWKDIILFTQSEKLGDDFTLVVVKITDMVQPSKALADKDELVIKSELKELGLVRKFIRRFCEKRSDLKLNEDRIGRIELAANEVVANIIRHAYSGREDGSIQINITVIDNQVVIKFFDWGIEFNQEVVPPPQFDGSQDGGFGVYIIINSVDDVKYTRDEGGKNCACLKVNI